MSIAWNSARVLRRSCSEKRWVKELPRQIMASNPPCTSRLSQRQSARTVLRMWPPFSRPFSKALASIAALPSTLTTSKPSFKSLTEQAGPGRDIEYLLGPALLELADKKVALALGPRVPVDKLVPLLDEALYVLDPVVVGLANLDRILTKRLPLLSGHGFFSPLETEHGVP